MKIKPISQKLGSNLVILITLVLIAIVATAWKGGWQMTFLGFTNAAQLIQRVGLYFMMGLVLGGMAQKLIPSTIIAKWLGRTSDLRVYSSGLISGYLYLLGPFRLCR